MTQERPNWNCPTLAEEAAFKAFIFVELDCRLSAQTAAMAAEVQNPENEQLLLDMIAAGWSPPPSPKRGRGRPPLDPEERRLLPSEAAARLALVIREIFKEHWGRWNRKRPSAEEIAAEYVGLRLKQVETRKKRGPARRPE